MAVETAASVSTPRSPLDDLRASIEAERRVATAEIEAFGAFLDRVESISSARPASTPAVQGVSYDGRREDGGLAAVRSAYEQTVMSCDHYAEEYEDTYAESVTAEFGPEIGTLLTEGSKLQPHLKRALLERVRTCRDDREHLLDMVEMEAESIDAIAPEFRAIRSEVREFAACPDPDAAGSYGALEAEWRRLDVLAEQLRELSTTRQRAIVAQRRRFHLPIDAPDMPVYLYQDRDDQYPLLSSFVRLQKQIQDRRSERERAIARA
jgi:hypothetical protein